jgi:hypothetical protein
MRETLIGIIVVLATMVNTSALKWWARVIAALVAAAIAVAISLCVPGCMSTTEIEGKTYSWRLDILAPIGATVPDPNPKPVRASATQPAK